MTSQTTRTTDTAMVEVPTNRDMPSAWARYSGGDVPAQLGGLVAAIGMLVILVGLFAAGAGNIALQMDALNVDGNVEEFSAAGAVVAVLVLMASFYVGGWVAARMARLDGRKNGVIVALWMMVLVVVFGALGIWAGSEYNVFSQVNLPDWVSAWDNADVTLAASLAAAAGALAMFAGAFLGGLTGDAYNARANAALAAEPTRPILN